LKLAVFQGLSDMSMAYDECLAPYFDDLLGLLELALQGCIMQYQSVSSLLFN